MTRPRRLLGALLVLTLTTGTAACGQKAGVDAQRAFTSDSGTVDSAPSGMPAPTVPPSVATEAGPGVTTSTATHSGPASTTSGPVPRADRRQPAAGPDRRGAPTAGTSTHTRTGAAGPASDPTPTTIARPAAATPGVTTDEIVVGIHLPITGAAPLPQDSLQKAVGLYWKLLAERGGVHGRNVRVLVRDDQFNPSRAVQVCRELVERHRVFLLMGFGADQVTACARYAAQAGVPYVAIGGPESGVAELPTFFSVAMSYEQQAPLLAQVVRRARVTEVGIVAIDTPFYDGVFRGLGSAVRDAGLRVVRASRISKQAGQSETLTEVNQLRTAGAKAVIFVGPPLVFLNLAHSAQGQAYSPLWAGPGHSNGINLVAEAGCPSIGGARFLSVFPQLDVIDRIDPDYRSTYRRHNGGEADDAGLIFWGLDKTIHQVLLAAGPDLTRQVLLDTVQSGREFASGVFPPVTFGPQQRFGGRSMHLVEADCSARRWRTAETFKSSF